MNVASLLGWRIADRTDNAYDVGIFFVFCLLDTQRQIMVKDG